MHVRTCMCVILIQSLLMHHYVHIMHTGIHVCAIFIAKGKVKPYNFFKRRNKHNEEKINVHSHTAGFYAVNVCTVDPQPSMDLTSTCIHFTTMFIIGFFFSAGPS